MKKLKEIKADYQSGKITKAQFIEDMHALHDRLFEYAKFIKDTDIKTIEISDDAVIMTSREAGIKMICDQDDQRIAPIEILNFDAYEEADAKAILRLIQDDFVVFDIGANFGWYSLNVARRFPHCRIHAFEPIPKTFQYLAANVRLNDFKNINIHNFGLADETKEIIFYYYPSGSGNASLANLTEAGAVQTTKGFVKTIDSFIEETKTGLDFIKCDVEGAELLVFRGGLETIKRHQPIIFTEMLRKWSKKFNYHPNEIIGLLAGIGYRCFVSQGDRLRPIDMIDDNTEETNFFFLHPAKHGRELADFSDK